MNITDATLQKVREAGAMAMEAILDESISSRNQILVANELHKALDALQQEMKS